MGKRREPRKATQVSVRIFGTDRDGNIFSENVSTVDISHTGVKLTGIRAKLQNEEIIGLTYGRNKVHFRVRWIGEANTPLDGQVGLTNLTPEKPLWDFPLPEGYIDNFHHQETRSGDRRKSPRVRCDVSVELRVPGASTIWGKASDLSVGGCFVEMPAPLPVNSQLEIFLWLNQTKVRLQGSVASAAPGFGIGVRFLNVNPQDRELLSGFVQVLAQLA